jgi:chromosomal replication initiator protein
LEDPARQFQGAQDNSQDGFNRPSFNTDEIWKIALEQVQLYVSPQNFNAWFKHTTLLKVEDGIATIACPNTFAREWLDANHHKLFNMIFKKVTNQNLEILFVVDSQQVSPKISSEDRYNQNSFTPGEAPIFNIPFTHQNLYEEAQQKASLNPTYLFETFVVGSSNRLAHAAAEAVADKPGRSYNPLFIWGGVGLGKTHLSQAIGNRILNTDPNKKILYCSSETFLNEMVESIRSGKAPEFRQNYRRLDMLIIDDIQFISEWQRAQEELFHTFNTLYQSGKQIVLISDRPPKQIDNLTDRLRSRFEGGMVADISEPDYELRIAIIQQKAQERGILLPEHILDFVAKSVESNIRELEGALIRISTHVKLGGVMPDEKGIAKILEIDPESKRKHTSPRDIIHKVCEEFGVSVRDVRGKRRTADLVVPRQVCMYVLRKELDLPLEQIARELNRGDHTTVMHAIGRVEEKMGDDEEFKERVRDVGR